MKEEEHLDRSKAYAKSNLLFLMIVGKDMEQNVQKFLILFEIMQSRTLYFSLLTYT
jgi:hypothetical protein